MTKLFISFLCLLFSSGMVFAQEIPPDTGNDPDVSVNNTQTKIYDFNDILLMKNSSHEQYPPLESGEMRDEVPWITYYDDLYFESTMRSSDNGYFTLFTPNNPFDAWAACGAGGTAGYTSSPPYYMTGRGSGYYADEALGYGSDFENPPIMYTAPTIVLSEPISSFSIVAGMLATVPGKILALDKSGKIIAQASLPQAKEIYTTCSPSGLPYPDSSSIRGIKPISLSSEFNNIKYIQFIVPNPENPFSRNWGYSVMFDDLITSSVKKVSKDLKISEINIGQTIYNPDFLPNSPIDPDRSCENTVGEKDFASGCINGDGEIDLVQGKAATAIAKIESSFSSAQPVKGELKIIKKSDGSVVFTEISDESFSVSKDESYIVKVKIPTTLKAGQYLLKAKVSLANGSSEMNTENNEMEIPLRVHFTYPLNVGVVRFSGCLGDKPCYTGVDESHLTPLFSEEFKRFSNDIFPLAEGGFSVEKVNGGEPLMGHPDRRPAYQNFKNGSRGEMLDLMKLDILAKASQKRKLMGIVDKSYFKYHEPNSGTLGFTVPAQYLSTGIFSSTDPYTLDHELAHLLGQNLELYQDNNPGPFIADISHSLVGYSGEGYLARAGGAEDEALTNRKPIMAGSEIPEKKQHWITPNTYLKAFQSLQYPSRDPERISITGLLSKDGTFEPIDFITYEDGLVTESESEGTFSVTALNGSGQKVSEVKITPVFKIRSKSELGTWQTYDTDITPIHVSIPVTEAVEQIQVTNHYGDIVLDKAVPKKMASASDIILQIPLDQFRGRFKFIRLLERASLRLLAQRADSSVKRENFKMARKQIDLLLAGVNRLTTSNSDWSKKETVARLKELRKFVVDSKKSTETNGEEKEHPHQYKHRAIHRHMRRNHHEKQHHKSSHGKRGALMKDPTRRSIDTDRLYGR